jgi:hypothetical protein
MKRPTTPEEFDLDFLRDLKHRLRMMLRDVQKREKQLLKEIKFVKRRIPSSEEVKAANIFYQEIYKEEEDGI